MQEWKNPGCCKGWQIPDDDLELTEDGIENVIKLGIAFSGKKVVIKAK